MPTDIALFIETYGLSAGILLLLFIVSIPITKWIIKITKLVEKNVDRLDATDKAIKNIHDGCHVPVGAVRALEVKVSKLEIKDTELDGDVKEINEHLTSVDSTLALIHASINKVDNKIDQMMLIQVQNAKNKE